MRLVNSKSNWMNCRMQQQGRVRLQRNCSGTTSTGYASDRLSLTSTEGVECALCTCDISIVGRDIKGTYQTMTCFFFCMDLFLQCQGCWGTEGKTGNGVFQVQPGMSVEGGWRRTGCSENGTHSRLAYTTRTNKVLPQTPKELFQHRSCKAIKCFPWQVLKKLWENENMSSELKQILWAVQSWLMS